MVNKQKILILGGGFGGIKTALELSGNPGFDVTLLSDQPNFRYYPMLYQTATGKNRGASSIPLDEIFANKNIQLVNSIAATVDRNLKIVVDSGGKSHAYDILIVALGVVTNFFGIKGLEEYAYGIKTLEQAASLRDHIHKQLMDDQKPDINYVVIGGGPTGVELAGALPGFIRHIMKSHKMTERDIHVDLVEAAPRLMPRMPENYSKKIQDRLSKLGVTLYLNQTVQAETANALVVSGHAIDSHTVIWTAGVTNHPFLKDNNFKLNDHGKALVNEFLQAEDNIYVIGDNADTMYSGMAQTALFDSKFVAGNLKLVANGRKPWTYTPKKPVYVTPVGPQWAAVLWGKVQMYGLLGWAIHRAADFAGYKDYEPWWRAAKLWEVSDNAEKTCDICG